MSATEPGPAGSAARALAYGLADVVTLRRGISRSINGESIRFPPRWARYYPGDYQRITHRFLRTRCVPGTAAIDVGAHLGVFTVVMARAVAPGGLVLSFEPTPDTREALARVVDRNGLAATVAIRPEAVARDVGVGSLHAVPVSGSNANSLVPDPRATQTFDVPTVSIDAVASDPPLSVSCLKIDAEGGEIDVLEGAQRTILRCNPGIALDVHPGALSRGGYRLDQLWDWGVERGYTIQGASGAMPRTDFLEREEPFDVCLVPE